MESEVETYTDKVWECVGKYFTLNESQWAPWAAPLVHARQRAMDRYAARCGEEWSPEVPAPSSRAASSAPSPPSPPLRARPRFPLQVEVVIQTRPKRKTRGDSPDASPAKPRKCDRCAVRPEECACVLREGAKNCDRCTVDKKGCRIDGESYSDWFDDAGYSRRKFTHSSCAFEIF